MTKVLVVIPIFNGEKYIAEAIDSVLSQTYQDFQIVVVDDGSNDNTEKIVLSYIDKYPSKIKYIRQNNGGAASARNRGIKSVSSEYVAFVDHDDVWLPEKLKYNMEVLENKKHLAFVCSEAYRINEHGEIIDKLQRLSKDAEDFESLFNRNFVLTLTVTARRSSIENVGFFDEKISYSEDYDLWLRLAKHYKYKYIDLPLAKYRTHSSQKSSNLYMIYANILKTLKKKEISNNVNFLTYRKKIAKLYYHLGEICVQNNNYLQASLDFLHSLNMHPIIGYYIWPDEIKKIRFTFIYRIFRIYFLCIYFLARAIKNNYLI
ncbi:MAG: glycosyltransferase [Candidatus Omnitrophota bacterium]|nr:glycosyltransferase [Candidatus Omnitrophota bacterium]